jgi:hypothetical protein
LSQFESRIRIAARTEQVIGPFPRDR